MHGVLSTGEQQQNNFDGLVSSQLEGNDFVSREEYIDPSSIVQQNELEGNDFVSGNIDIDPSSIVQQNEQMNEEEEIVEEVANEYKSPLTNIKNILEDDSEEKIIIVPTDIYERVKLLSDDVSLLTEDDIKTYLSDEDKVALDVAINGLPSIAPKGAFTDKVNPMSWTQNLPYEDKEIGLSPLKINEDSLSGVITGKKAQVKINSMLGLANEYTIPLYHSGFSINFGYIGESDISGLTGRLAKEKLELGKNTNGLVFTNDNVLFSSILLDFMVEHMTSSTLKLDVNDDIRMYIETPDIYNIAIGMLKVIEPNGFKISRTCVNAVQTDENIKPKCNFTLTARLNLELVTFVDRDALGDFHKKLLARRRPNSITKEELKEYKETLDVLKAKDVSIELNNGKVIILTLQVPKLVDNISAGETWIEDVVNSVEMHLNNIEEVNDAKKISMLNKMSRATILNRYLHYVKSITMDESIVNDRAAIYDTLTSMVSTSYVYNEVAKAFSDFIDDNVISVIGIPQYVCPDCGSSEDMLDGAFKEVIPMNVYHTFLEGCTLKVYELEKRTETTY